MAASELVRTAVTEGSSAPAGPVRAARTTAAIPRKARRLFLKNEWYIGDWLPVIIDRTRTLAFIKLHSPLFVLHRLQEKLSLLLAHLPVLLRLRGGGLCVLCILIWFFLASSFYFTRWFFRR